MTSDTVVAQLAGGLGVPTWLLFRQSPGGNWAEPIRAMQQALGPFLRSRLDRGLPARVRVPKAAWETSRSSDRCLQLA